MIRRQFLARTAILFAAAALNASCGNEMQSADPENPTIRIWHGFTSEETVKMKELFGRFETEWEKSHPGRDLEIKFEYVQYGDMFTKLKSAAMANITPDIALMDSIKVTDMALGRGVVALDELDAFKAKFGTIDEARTHFVEASFNSGVVNRRGEVHLYGLPVQTTTVSLFWNRAWFRNKSEPLRAAGLDPNRPPRDWNEFLAYGKVLSDPANKKYAYGMYRSMWFTFPIFNMYGVDFITYDEEGRATAALNTENGRAAVNMLRDLTRSGYEGGAWRTGATGPDQGFLNGDYAMCFTGPWKVEEYKNAGLDFDIAMIPGPPPEDVERLRISPKFRDRVESLGTLAWTASNVGGQTGVILRSCDQRELAFEILEYFTSDPVQREWSSTLGQIPVRKSAWVNLDMSKFPFMKKFMDQLEYSKRVPQIPLYGTLEDDIFNKQYDLFLQSEMSAEEFLGRVEREMQAKILDKLNAPGKD